MNLYQKDVWHARPKRGHVSAASDDSTTFQHELYSTVVEPGLTLDLTHPVQLEAQTSIFPAGSDHLQNPGETGESL